MEHLWVHSLPVDNPKEGHFTSLPIRIHRRNDIADDATKRSIEDWGAYIGDGWEQKSGSSWSPVGNWGAFIYPESLPERLGVIVYLANMGNIHDDLCDELEYDDAVAEHADLSEAMRAADGSPESRASNGSSSSASRKDKMQQYLAKCMLEALEIDRPRALRMLESYRVKWLDVMEAQNPSEIQTLDEYLVFRNLNGGMEPFWSMVQYGMAIDVSPAEEIEIRPIFRAAEAALVLTNDYWSWDREWRQAQRRGKDARVVNAVELLMRVRGLAMDDARRAVREHILAFEGEYVRLRDEYYDKHHPDVPQRLRRYIEVCGLIVAGNHYWCANCPRHNAWREEEGAAMVQAQLPVVVNEGHGPRLTAFKSLDEVANPRSDEAAEWTSESSPPTSPELTAFEAASISSKSSITAPSSRKASTSSIEHTKADTMAVLRAPASSPAPRTFGKVSNDDDNDEALDAIKKPHGRALLSPCNYISTMPSKGVRSLLISALHTWFPGVDAPRLAQVKHIVDVLHNSSLILDDIEDGSALRRGLPATHVVFGEAQAINSANYMFVQAVQLARQLRSPVSLDVLMEELECLFLGQSWDLYWRHNLHTPTEDEYLEMVDNKTGAMFRMLTRLLIAEASPGKTEVTPPQRSTCGLRQLCRLFGRFFQIRDDFMNLNSSEYSDQKGFCEDLDEGKMSFLIVRLAAAEVDDHRHRDARDQVMGILRRRQMAAAGSSTGSPGGQTTTALPRETKMHMLRCLKTLGIMDATLGRLRELEAGINDCIGRIEREMGTENAMLRVLMHKLSVRDVEVV